MAWTREQWMVVLRALWIVGKLIAAQYCFDLVDAFSHITPLNPNCVQDQTNLRSYIVVPVLGYIVRLLVAHGTASFVNSIMGNIRNLWPLIELRFPDELLQLRIAMVNFFRWLDQFLMPRRNLYRQG